MGMGNPLVKASYQGRKTKTVKYTTRCGTLTPHNIEVHIIASALRAFVLAAALSVPHFTQSFRSAPPSVAVLSYWQPAPMSNNWTTRTIK